MFKRHLKTAIYITHNNIYIADVRDRDNPGYYKQAWDGNDLIAPLTEITTNLSTKEFLCIVGSDESFTWRGSFPTDSEPTRDQIASLATAHIPENFTDEQFDWRRVGENMVEVVVLSSHLYTMCLATKEELGLDFRAMRSAASYLLDKIADGTGAYLHSQFEPIFLGLKEGELVLNLTTSSDHSTQYLAKLCDMEQIDVKNLEYSLFDLALSFPIHDGDDAKVMSVDLRIPVDAEPVSPPSPSPNSRPNSSLRFSIPTLIIMVIITLATLAWQYTSHPNSLPTASVLPVLSPSPIVVIANPSQYEVEVKNGTTKIGLAKNIADSLAEQGFVNVKTGNVTSQKGTTIEVKSALPTQIQEPLNTVLKNHNPEIKINPDLSSQYVILITIGN